MRLKNRSSDSRNILVRRALFPGHLWGWLFKDGRVGATSPANYSALALIGFGMLEEGEKRACWEIKFAHQRGGAT